MVLVIGSLGRWGRGKTMTLAMLQELTKTEPEALEFAKPQVIISNFLTKFMDYYVAIEPKVSEVFNRFTGKKVPVLDLFDFLARPVGDIEYFMFLDDVYSWLASYYFGNAFNQAAFRLLAAGRKKGISIGESSVRFKDVDPRLRALHTHLFLPKFNGDENIVKIERYAVDVFEDVRIYPDLYYDATRYFDVYDTKEIIESVYQSPSRAPAKTKIANASVTTVQRLVQSAVQQVPKFEYINRPPPARDWSSQGYNNREKGNKWQHILVEEIKKSYPAEQDYTFYESPEEAGRSIKDPDFVVSKNGKPVAVYAVKTCEVVPSNQRRQADGTWKKNADTYHDTDLQPELLVAKDNGLPLHLFILNTLNMKIDDHLIEDPINFKVYSTNAELAGGVPKKKLDAGLLEARVLQLPFDRKILDAYLARETNPSYRRMTNRELASAFGVNQTEMERAIQQIKIDLGSGNESTVRSEDQGANLKVSISKSVQTSPSISARTVETAKAFGLGIDSSQKFSIFENLQLEIQPGDVIYVTGDSGSGKSMLLKELQPILERKFGKTVCEGNPSLQTTQVSNDEIVIDNIGSDFDDAMRILSSSGLSEAFIMMRKFSELSEGQKYRYRIAKTMNDKESRVWIFDEFVATLDRDLAKAVAYTLQGAARKMGKILVVATTHEDLLQDLNPTLFIKKLFGSEVRVERFPYTKRDCSLLADLKIEEGTREDFVKLEQFHYKGAGLPGTTKRIYTAKIRGELVGGIFYASCNPHLAGRTIAVPEYSKGASNSEMLHLLNRDFLRIARVVILPKYRGIGLGVKLVRDTMPMTGYPFIETLAVMARVNPFFEHAGMTRIQMATPEERDKAYASALETLNQLGFDLEMITSATYNKEILDSLSQEQKVICQGILLRHFTSPKFGGVQFREGIQALDTEAMAQAFTKARLDMAYLIWKSPDPKFASLPAIRIP